MMNNDNILVIVPPKPDYALEFSYSNLYSNPSDPCDYNHNQHGDVSDYYSYYPASPAPAILLPSSECRAVSPAVGGAGGGRDDSSATNSSLSARSTTATSFAMSSTSTMAAVVAFDSSNFDAFAGDNHNSGRGHGASIITRDPRNGAFTFQVHAEYDMLLRVQRDLDGHRGGSARPPHRDGEDDAGRETDDDGSAEDSIRLSRRIMHSIDDYCMHEQWMYHIGQEKGMALSRFLLSSLEEWHRAGDGGDDRGRKKFVCVELGTYCGYSALVLAVTLRRYQLERKQPHRRGGQPSTSTTPFEFQIYTTEVSTKVLNVARSIFRLAGMEDCITPILLQGQECAVVEHDQREDDDNDLSRVLRDRFSIPRINFLFLDHAKHLYLRDLENLERSKLIGRGSYVCADNVVFNRLDSYREHMHALEHGGGGVVETRLEEMNLEYSNNLKDGMGELSVLSSFVYAFAKLSFKLS
jgi:predicted O-methyltransferase YrrM